MIIMIIPIGLKFLFPVAEIDTFDKHHIVTSCIRFPNVSFSAEVKSLAPKFGERYSLLCLQSKRT